MRDGRAVGWLTVCEIGCVGAEENAKSGAACDESSARALAILVLGLRVLDYQSGPAYMIPCSKVAVGASFDDISRLNFHASGSGMISMIAPVTTFGIVMNRAKATTSMHLPPWTDLSHS